MFDLDVVDTAGSCRIRQGWRVRGKQIGRQIPVIGDSGQHVFRGESKVIRPSYAPEFLPGDRRGDGWTFPATH
jgi:hypothetical protein